MNKIIGSIWRSIEKRSNRRVVIKVTSRQLHSKSMMILNGKKCNILENILKEKKILKLLTRNKNKDRAPICKGIIKYIDCYKTNSNYYLIMEDGGQSLFDVCSINMLS